MLVNGALKLGAATGANPIILGATVIAVATTLPEIMISTIAVVETSQGMAVGNAVGGMLVNFGLVLGVYMLLRPTVVSRRDVFVKGCFIALSLGLLLFASLSGNIGVLDGAVMIGVFAVFIAFTVWQAKRARPTYISNEHEMIMLSTDQRAKLRNGAILGLALGQALLIFGAWMLVSNGERLAEGWGVSESIIGFTLIAAATSLPEFVTIIAAIRRKSSELALGNILGSNIINATLLVGICAVTGYAMGVGLVVPPQIISVALPVLVGVCAVALLPMLLRGRTYRWQGAVLLAAYISYMVYILSTQL